MDTNNIQGQIPQELGHLSLLKTIDFPVNHLVGEIPESIFNLSNLILLSLTQNEISGNLPSSLNNGLPVLESLYLAGNLLSGEIPSGISNFSKLSTLDLTQNSFSGQVPMTLGNLRDLQTLSLQYNQLTNDPSMVELDFLSPLTNCRQLKILRFGFNSFNGMLPKVLGNFSQSVETITAGFCGIKGMIPSEIGNLSNIIYFAMGGNDLIGTIPDTMGQMRKMQKLIIRKNKLWGSIPVNLCNMVNLYYLQFTNNQLSGQLPWCLGNISSLQNIYLDYNGLTSTIPSTLWSNKEIQILELSHNLLIGSLSQEIGSLKSLRELHLSENQFSGDIPTNIGELQSLQNLTLSNNNLHGPIPESFGDLKELEYLDLSHNNLSGLIPKSLESLEYLKYFNVSFNKLGGEIPNGGPFKNLTRDSFIGNGELCGASRFMVVACKSITSKSSSKTRYLKYILPSCALVACIVIFVVWFVRCNRNKPLPTQSSFPIALTIKRISYYEILSATNNFDEENLIGRGSIGSVYKGLFSDGTIAAIKVFNLDVEGALKSFDTECSILCNIRHRNLVKVITCCSNLDLKALVLEYMPKGNLSSWLYSSDYCQNIVQRLEIMIDVASALKYLHHEYTSPIVHCDLKPNNILLDEDMVARVVDFGISKLFKEDQRISQTKTLGTIGYMAPEYGSTGLISTMADVYSYGIMLMKTFTKKKPTDPIFEGELTMRRWVVESFPDAIMQIVDIDVVDEVEENIRSIERCITSIMGLALECTSDLPEERLKMKDILIRLQKIKIEFPPGITMRISRDALVQQGP
ncbi:receptor kinase-like protein Xa21 [Olea europaea var. sylvestris]|uniref:receptor kinase-like protein Xa21 n=1 Tax=Olea europaea var. sylvestris TaxID=158386 RepID=UPI000C1CD0CD|nr:receptor kinase-like protein Xa21 [Olea europaea var. sylvestris]